MQFSPESLQMTRRDGDYYGNGRSAWEQRNGEMAGLGTGMADGYESFENMSNKKKRKIPQSGVGGHGHSHSLSAEIGNLTLEGRSAGLAVDVDGDGDGKDGEAYAGNSYGYVHNSPGAVGGATAGAVTRGAGAELSGPGRGRFGRSGRGSMDRRPLGELSHCSQLSFTSQCGLRQ